MIPECGQMSVAAIANRNSAYSWFTWLAFNFYLVAKWHRSCDDLEGVAGRFFPATLSSLTKLTPDTF